MLNRDAMGASMSVRYKGREAFPTRVGAFFTLCVKLLVLVKFV